MEQVLLIAGLFIILPYMFKMLPFLNPHHIYDPISHEKIPLTELNKWAHHLQDESQAKGVKLTWQDITQEQWDKIDWSKFDYNTFNKTNI